LRAGDEFMGCAERQKQKIVEPEQMFGSSTRKKSTKLQQV